MITAILCLFVGLMLGWFVLPQPDWAKALYSKILGMIDKSRA